MDGAVVLSSLQHCVIHEIGDGIYVAQPRVGRGATCNAGIVALGDRAAIFDTFLTPAAAIELREAAEDLTSSPVKLVINSHHHIGHIGGNQIYDDDVDLFATTATRELIATHVSQLLAGSHQVASALATLSLTSNSYQINKSHDDYQALMNALPSMTIRLPNVTFDQKMVVHGQNRCLEIFTYGGGHTQSDAILYLPDDDIIFMGDLLCTESHPFLGDGDPGELPRILDLVSQLDPVTIVPGHGQVGTLADVQTMQSYLAMLTETALTELAFQFEDGGELEQKVAKFKPPQPYAHWERAEFYTSNLQFLYERVMTAYAD